MGDYIDVKETFGCDVFNDSVMQERLPKKIYKELKRPSRKARSFPWRLRMWWHMR